MFITAYQEINTAKGEYSHAKGKNENNHVCTTVVLLIITFPCILKIVICWQKLY